MSQIGECASDQVVVEKTVDADGRLKSVFKDNLGRILGTSNGDDEPKYHVYDRFDRLCAVVGSGIELSDTLNMWRYDYDSLGRLASRGIPSSVREYYEYDSEDRLVSVQGFVCLQAECRSFAPGVRDGQKWLLSGTAMLPCVH